MKLIYDIETNGLNPDKIWCMCAIDVDSGVEYKFSDYDNDLLGSDEAKGLLNRAEVLIGHNIIGFDNRVVKKIWGLDLNEKKNYDTFIMSQTLRYKRKHKHGLGGWGEALGNAKGDFHDWDNYSKEMLRYCMQDVRVNKDIFHALMKEYQAIHSRNPLIKEGLKIEHDAAIFNSKVRERGWLFDESRARTSLTRMLDRMAEIEKVIEPLLGYRKVYIDKTPKTPKFTKNGNYSSTSARIIGEFLGRTVKVEDTHLMPAGTEFQRYRNEKVTMGSMDLVKEWLKSIGWKPDDWVVKKVGFEWIRQSPKLTTTSLIKLGEKGKLIDEYYTLRSRKAVIEGWLNSVVEGRIHGNMWTIGTPTFRCRHEVIVNLPAVTAAWGKELRELFSADPGMVVVGADSSGNQLRGLCHYVDNPGFTNEVIYGDQHQRNADALGCSRPVAKSYLYAYLFGAGDGKLGQVLTGKTNPSKGKASRDAFAASIKGLGNLREKLANVWKKTFHGQGEGWFPAIDGRPVFCPAEHQTLNYLLQSMEGISCKAAISYAMENIKKQGLRAEPRLFYHDEQAWVSHPDDADAVGKILKDSFKEAPKMFGITCMDGGDYVKGTSYADVH